MWRVLSAPGLLLVALSAGPLTAQSATRRLATGPALGRRAQNALGPRVLHAARIQGLAPRIDGVIDERVWDTAEPAGDLIQTAPEPGALATLPTTVRVLFDDEALYVAVRLADPGAESILAPFPRRDDETTSDWVFVEVDSRFDRRTGYSFGLNPRGVQADGAWSNDVDYDGAWNGIWEAAATIDRGGWSAEFRIPFSQLPLGRSGAGQPMVWGINFYRYVPHRGETANWSPRLPSVAGVVSHFNRLEGLVVPPSRRAVEITPYASTTLISDAAATPGAGSDLAGAVGLDFRLRPSGTTTIAAALHPDFGQVEADPSQVNLTTFETFLPEQRPLFVDGSEAVQFDESLAFDSRGASFEQESPFYTRRIGRPPIAGCPPAAVTVCRVATATPVLGAARASASTASGWSGGFFQAWTAPQHAAFRDSVGAGRTTLVEPLSHFSAARIRREFADGHAAVGALATFTGRIHRRDGLDSLAPGNAMLLGTDGRFRFGHDRWELTGFALASRVTGDSAYIRRLRAAPLHGYARIDRAGGPDSAGTFTSLAGVAGQLRVTRTAGRLQWGAAARAVTPGFEQNELGFQRAADWLLLTTSWLYQVFRPGHRIRRWSIGSTQLGAAWTLGGMRRAAVANVTGRVDLASYWGGRIAWDHEFDASDPEVLRGGPALRLPARDRVAAQLYSDTRRRWQLTMDGSVERERASGSLGAAFSPSLSAFVTDRLQLGLTPAVEARTEGWQYAGQGTDGGGAPHYVLGRLRQTTASLTTRATYAFSSHLTLQLYGQVFLSDGRFDRFTEVTNPSAAEADARVTEIDAARLAPDAAGGHVVDAGAAGEYHFADPAFSDRDLHLNLLLRWEFRPGSTLYLVWTHRRFDGLAQPFSLGRDLDRLWAAPSENAIQAKVSYWLGT